ncbi:hypothetical protein GCM10011396_36430 [Undibacterium terreum]|uniref:Uncharacterized protein n=1 Tax=Undibacterium terreum TaxID=1224302 RepID=A0A916XM26_9BURK|nr:hypothetical protein GCM10011396_36430 [Undibacterium terreum]
MSAKTVTSCPTAVTLVAKSLARLGSSGAIIMPSVPMANVPNASQYNGILEELIAGAGTLAVAAVMTVSMVLSVKEILVANTKKGMAG